MELDFSRRGGGGGGEDRTKGGSSPMVQRQMKIGVANPSSQAQTCCGLILILYWLTGGLFKVIFNF